MDADGFSVLAFKDAQERARTWFEEQERLAAGEDAPTGPYTVADAMTDYLASMESEGKKSAQDTRTRAEAMIIPELGKFEISKLTTSTIRQWRNTLAQTPARTRTRRGDEQRYRNVPDNPESIRQRRSSANRLLSILKAALNHAFREGKVHSDLAWRRVTPFKKVEAARVRYLSDDESRRLVNACSEPLRSMVIAGFMTGARYSELAALQVVDFDRDANAIHIRTSKSGKPRHVYLTDEGRVYFERAIAGKASDEPIFTKPTGRSWRRSEQRKPLLRACEAARIKPAIGFHILRHTYASRLVMRGVALPVIAAQLGHADSQMVEKHYGHLAPSYVADTIRAAFGTMGLAKPDNVAPTSTAADQQGFWPAA
jgi:integrase